MTTKEDLAIELLAQEGYEAWCASGGGTGWYPYARLSPEFKRRWRGAAQAIMVRIASGLDSE